MSGTALTISMLGALGLVWGVVYTTVHRLVPGGLLPGCLHERVRRVRAAVPWVAGASVLLLALSVLSL